MLLVVILAACVQPSSAPFVGDCARYPDGGWEYGSIGIGTCLSGPTSLTFIDDPARPESHLLAVTNSNPFLDFSGGSLLVIDLDTVPLDGSGVPAGTVQAGSLDLPSYAGVSAWVGQRGLMGVPVRFSEDARGREDDDEVWLVDLTTPLAPRLAPVAEDGASTVLVERDPTPSAFDPVTGLMWVANIASGTLTALDMYADPVGVVDVVGLADVSAGRFYDDDQSGSRVEVTDLEVSTAVDVRTDGWTLTRSQGTTTFWVPTAEGVLRLAAPGLEPPQPVGTEPELDPTQADIGPASDPQPWSSALGDRMAFADASTNGIRAAVAIEGIHEWALEDFLLVPFDPDLGEVAVGGPSPLSLPDIELMFFDTLDEMGMGGIDLATSSDGVVWERQGSGGVVLPGNGPHDSLRAAGPSVLYDEAARLWRLYYGAWDGAAWTVGHATSPDLVAWTADPEPIFTIPGGSAAAPVVSRVADRFVLWTARDTSAGWAVGLATSLDGTRWQDEGIVAELGLTVVDLATPPGVGILHLPDDSWSLASDDLGLLPLAVPPGQGVVVEGEGFSIRLTEGAWIGTSEFGDEGRNGVTPDSVLVPEGLLAFTVTDTDGRERVALGTWSDEEGPRAGPVVLFGDQPGLDGEGASSGVLLPGGQAMLYAATAEGRTVVARATTADGATWVPEAVPALEPGEEWESVAVVPGSVVAAGGDLFLWYTGSDGERTRIGLASSVDGGVTWSRVPGDEDLWWLDAGRPGTFDDSGVSDPWVIRDDAAGVERLWYTGFDGTTPRIGYAERPLAGGGWERALDPVSEDPRPVLFPVSGSFDADGATRPVAVPDEGGWTVLYGGFEGSVVRTGLARGAADRLYRDPRGATLGDRVVFSTVAGDAGAKVSFPLATDVEGFRTSGDGIVHLWLDPTRGWLYVSSASSAYVYVVDVREDGSAMEADPAPAVEALLFASAGAIGFRSAVTSVDGTRLYALNDSPESVMLFDLEGLEDGGTGQVVRNAVVGGLPAPRGGVRDAGADTSASVGPSQLVATRDHLFVSNFNANTVGVYDLRLGVDGTLVDEVLVVGENPSALALSPDGRLLVVASYVGLVDGGATQSVLTFIDVDPASPTWLQVLGWLENLG